MVWAVSAHTTRFKNELLYFSKQGNGERIAAVYKGWSRGWIKLIASGPYIYKYVCVCERETVCTRMCLCTICPVVRKDKRKLIKKFLIRIFSALYWILFVCSWPETNYRKFFAVIQIPARVMMCPLFLGKFCLLFLFPFFLLPTTSTK